MQYVLDKYMNKVITFYSPRKANKYSLELFNCDTSYLKTCRKVVAIHGGHHSILLL